LTQTEFEQLVERVRFAAEEAEGRRPRQNNELAEYFKLDMEINHFEHCSQVPGMEDPLQQALLAADPELEPLHAAMACIKEHKQEDLARKRKRCRGSCFTHC
jgi:hypothetical protein